MAQTEDGVEVTVGMPIYCIVQGRDYTIEKHIVERIEGYKLIYKDPLPDGYIGARCDWTYSSYCAAELGVLIKRKELE